MANPGKIYNLPCQLIFEYAGANDQLVMMDKIKIGPREFQINGTLIEVGK